MIIDARNEFSDAQDIAGAGAAVIVGINQIDTSAVVRDLGAGDPIYLIVTVDTDIVASVGASTLKLALCSDLSPLEKQMGAVGHTGDFVYGGQAAVYSIDGWRFVVLTNAAPSNDTAAFGSEYIAFRAMKSLGLMQ